MPSQLSNVNSELCDLSSTAYNGIYWLPKIFEHLVRILSKADVHAKFMLHDRLLQVMILNCTMLHWAQVPILIKSFPEIPHGAHTLIGL